jgi:hypothetical protein
VEILQPFKIETGQKNLVRNVTDVSDGDRSVHLDLESFAMGQSRAYITDMGDTNGSRDITISYT